MLPALLLGIFFLIMLPQLGWMEFSTAEESVNVATAMELRRDGNWKVPTLAGLPRYVKPPMTTWTTGLFISRESLAALDGMNPEQAYHAFAIDARLPALLAGCVLLLGAYLIGKAVGGDKLAITSVVLCGTNFLFLRHAMTNETDIQLAAWVTLTNGLLAMWLLRGKSSALIVAGVTLGLGIMAKGPIAILQSAIPCGVFWFIRGRSGQTPRLNGKAAIATVLMLAIGFSWFIWVGSTTPGIWDIWLREVTRHHANNLAPIPWYRYFTSFEFFFPWVVFIIFGIVETIRDWQWSAAVLPLLMFAVPFAVMVWFPERKERYLVPMVAPLAVVAADALLRAMGRRDKVLLVVQWGFILAFAIAPLALTQQKDTAWARSIAAGASLVLMLVWAVGCTARRLVLTAAIVFLSFHAFYWYVTANSPGGKNSMRPAAEAIRGLVPDARYFCFHPSHQFEAVFSDAADLQVYANRTVRWVEDPANVKPDGAQVWFTVQGNGEEPPKAPAATRDISKVQRRGEVWWFFIR